MPNSSRHIHRTHIFLGLGKNHKPGQKDCISQNICCVTMFSTYIKEDTSMSLNNVCLKKQHSANTTWHDNQTDSSLTLRWRASGGQACWERIRLLKRCAHTQITRGQNWTNTQHSKMNSITWFCSQTPLQADPVLDTIIHMYTCIIHAEYIYVTITKSSWTLVKGLGRAGWEGKGGNDEGTVLRYEILKIIKLLNYLKM